MITAESVSDLLSTIFLIVLVFAIMFYGFAILRHFIAGSVITGDFTDEDWDEFELENERLNREYERQKYRKIRFIK